MCFYIYVMLFYIVLRVFWHVFTRVLCLFTCFYVFVTFLRVLHLLTTLGTNVGSQMDTVADHFLRCVCALEEGVFKRCSFWNTFENPREVWSCCSLLIKINGKTGQQWMSKWSPNLLKFKFFCACNFNALVEQFFNDLGINSGLNFWCIFDSDPQHGLEILENVNILISHACQVICMIFMFDALLIFQFVSSIFDAERLQQIARVWGAILTLFN